MTTLTPATTPDTPIDPAESLVTLKRVAAQFCFDVVCPICGQELCEGGRHECRLITGPLSYCECEQQGARKCGACD